METVLDQLQALRDKRHEAAQRVYSEIAMRYDKPRPGDAEALEQAMRELHIDMHHLEADLHLVQQYRTYLEAEAKSAPGCEHCAQDIRHGNKALFMALDDERDLQQTRPEPSATH